jgi:hypothetical protein
MKNPWNKKNPLMSTWLSGANAVIGAARSRATVHTKRQAAIMMAEGGRQIIRFWTGALGPPPTRKKKNRR